MSTSPELAGSFQAQWEQSYTNRDNFLFYPHEEVIRFTSRHIRKRVGLNEFVDLQPASSAPAVLDLGCGIGRHVMYCHDMGFRAYGIDLSAIAIETAHSWARSKGAGELVDQIVQGDVRRLPWAGGFFQHAISHGVLDSMPFAVAREACVELARVLSSGGLFYCDLISGDDSKHAREFAGEEIVTTRHEMGTVQVYFNMSSLRALIDGVFKILECHLIRREDVVRGGHSGRYHVVLKRI